MRLVLFLLIAGPFVYYAGLFLTMALFRVWYGYKPDPKRQTPQSPRSGDW